MQKSEAIQNHKIKDKESGLYHVMFTKILKDGKRTRDEFHVVLYTGKEFKVFKRHTDNWGLGATGFDEYEVIHDPTTAKRVVEKKVENQEEQNEEIEAIKQFLVENDVKFNHRLGLTKLRKLKEETELKTE